MRITPASNEHGEELTHPMRPVGAVLEASGYHPGRTALEHLRVLGETGLEGNARLRGYLRQLADEVRTVPVSSHALSEVEQTADHVLVLAGGRLLVLAVLSYLNSEASP